MFDPRTFDFKGFSELVLAFCSHDKSTCKQYMYNFYGVLK